MSESKHTPGEWKRGRFASYIATTGEPVRYVYRPGDDERTRIAVFGPNCDEDAALIAAGPEMHEALKADESSYQHWSNCEKCQTGAHCEEGHELRYQAQKKRLAALAKAEGRTG